MTKDFDAANKERQAAVDMVENGQVWRRIHCGYWA